MYFCPLKKPGHASQFLYSLFWERKWQKECYEHHDHRYDDCCLNPPLGMTGSDHDNYLIGGKKCREVAWNQALELQFLAQNGRSKRIGGQCPVPALIGRIMRPKTTRYGRIRALVASDLSDLQWVGVVQPAPALPHW